MSKYRRQIFNLERKIAFLKNLERRDEFIRLRQEIEDQRIERMRELHAEFPEYVNLKKNNGEAQ